MKRQLPDVNVLLALLWPRLESHAAAHTWFARSGQYAWATNPLTQLGVLRLLTNPAITQAAVSATAALAVLSKAISHAKHEFWPLGHELPGSLPPLAARIQGHQQWTDAALLWHAKEHGGILVTFDTGLKDLAGEELARHVQLLKQH
jgi:toxin-antitoxin system PIN domain toxin